MASSNVFSQQEVPSFSSLSPPPVSVNVANFVSTKLQWFWHGVPNHNYAVWREQMLCLIESQGLMQFVDGTASLPLPPCEYLVWGRTDMLLKGWILGSLSDQVPACVLGLSTAMDVWFALEKQFTPVLPQLPFLVAEEVSATRSASESAQLYRAALDGDWEAAERIFKNDPSSTTNWIDVNQEARPLDIAVGAGKKAIRFVENLVALLSDESVALRDRFGSTALHLAAALGKVEAATVLVNRIPRLCYIQNKSGDFPIHYAALYAQREVLDFLIFHTEGDFAPNVNPYGGSPWLQLLNYLIQAEFFDIAFRLIETYPYMLRQSLTYPGVPSPLTAITIKKHALSSPRHFNFWERFIFSCMPDETTTLGSNSVSSRSMTNEYATHKPPGKCMPDETSTLGSNSMSILRGMRWKFMELLVPRARVIRDKMRVNQQALQLTRRICTEIGSLGFWEATDIYGQGVFTAAELGVREVVEVIIETSPGAIYSYDRPSGQSMFHRAVEHRSEDVFNLIYQMSDRKYLFTNLIDSHGNTLLHSAGKLAPSHKLNKTCGATLQMQREIQWFEEVESWVHANSRERKNNDGKTPKMVFTEEHTKLKEEGEKWTKDAANSGSVAAALIATVMFAAAITVPGGNKCDSGVPIFSREIAFIIFALSDAASLVMSITSLLMFVSILTARYAEQDFLHLLPKRLTIGLGALSLSMAFMMVSFSVTFYLVFGEKKAWVLVTVLALASLPVTSFVLMHFPLLLDFIASTYGPGIFGKKGSRPCQ